LINKYAYPGKLVDTQLDYRIYRAVVRVGAQKRGQKKQLSVPPGPPPRFKNLTTALICVTSYYCFKIVIYLGLRLESTPFNNKKGKQCLKC
jgi:hypothetical protein